MASCFLRGLLSLLQKCRHQPGACRIFHSSKIKAPNLVPSSRFQACSTCIKLSLMDCKTSVSARMGVGYLQEDRFLTSPFPPALPFPQDHVRPSTWGTKTSLPQHSSRAKPQKSSKKPCGYRGALFLQMAPRHGLQPPAWLRHHRRASKPNHNLLRAASPRIQVSACSHGGQRVSKAEPASAWPAGWVKVMVCLENPVYLTLLWVNPNPYTPPTLSPNRFWKCRRYICNYKYIYGVLNIRVQTLPFSMLLLCSQCFKS